MIPDDSCCDKNNFTWGDIWIRPEFTELQIASAWYAIEDALEGKTTTFMSDTRNWCRQYHDALGIGCQGTGTLVTLFLPFLSL